MRKGFLSRRPDRIDVKLHSKDKAVFLRRLLPRDAFQDT